VPPTNAVEPDAPVARFARDLSALDVAPTIDRPLALAVSGGPDSMAMLWLGWRAFPDAVIAATVDHALRPGSSSEARVVARWCAAAGISHRTLKRRGPVFRSAIQARAREARYALLADWALAHDAVAIATAHHADDQAETFLMRANRGVGVAGLAGIRARRDQIVRREHNECTMPIVRPLLGWRRDELAAVVAAAQLPSVTDPSNADDRYERTAARRLLADAPFLDPAQLARSARHAAETNGTLSAVETWLWDQRRGADTSDRDVSLDMADLPRELQRRLAREAIARVATAHDMPTFDRATNIEPLLDALTAGRSATQGGVMVTPTAEIWRFFAAPPRRSA